MRFENPNFLFFLFLVPLIILLLYYVRQRKAATLGKLGRKDLIEFLTRNYSQSGVINKHAIWLFSLSLLIIASARPQWGGETRVVERDGLQIVVVLDVSESMYAEDVFPNRLSYAKQVINGVLEKSQGDEFALVAFAGTSIVRFPLTTDIFTAKQLVNDVNQMSVSRPGSDIGGALLMALQAFDDTRSSQKIVFLLTDGEDHSESLQKTVRRIQEEKVLVYIVGIGTSQGVKIPVRNSNGDLIGFFQDENGIDVITSLREETLSDFSAEVGGQLFFSQANENIDDLFINQLEQYDKQSYMLQTEMQGVDRYQIFVLLAILLLFIYEIIPIRKKNEQTQVNS